jgi:DNA-binding transcriptional LysR family regulator
MDRLHALRTFIAVAENASFAEAGRRLRMSPTTVTRIIANLEQSAGAPLLVRTTRTVHLTGDGAIFLRRCRAALAEIDEAFETIRGGSREPHGTLTVTAPVMFGRLHILPIVIDMLRTFPDLQIRLLLLDRVTNMVDEDIDVAVRIGDPPDSALHMVRIGEVRRMFSASPDYVGMHGAPATMADLSGHTLIDIEDERGRPAEWQAPRSRGSRPAATRLSVNSMDAAISAAMAGLGIVRTLSYQVASHFADGTLVPVATTEAAPAIPVSLLFQSGRRDTPNIRTFLEQVREHLSPKLPRLAEHGEP